MSYWTKVAHPTTGEMIPFHINSRGKCKAEKVPLGVGHCPRCVEFAQAMEQLILAVYARYGDQPSEEVPRP